MFLSPFPPPPPNWVFLTIGIFVIGGQTDNSETRNNILCDIVDDPVIFSLMVIDSACHKIAVFLAVVKI